MNPSLSLQIPSPVQRIDIDLYREKNLEVYIKREDLIHPEVSGNKWRKLKYNIEQAKKENKGILTFGGAFSNHIYATAHAARYFGLPCIGLIRGKYVDLNNPSLSAVRAVGMQLELLSREEYGKKEEEDFLEVLQKKYPDYLIIPEGGNNAKAIEGLKELGKEINDLAFTPDLILVPAGTASTARGLLRSIPKQSQLLVFSSLKGDFLNDRLVLEENENWILQTEFHFGGYARVNADLINTINTFKTQTGIPLDPIYTAKMLYGFHALLERGAIEANSKILLIHTGGLQGILGHNIKYQAQEELRIQ